MMADQLLRGATLADGSRADVRVRDGVIDAVGDSSRHPRTPRRVVDLDGWLLLPAAAEPHAHLDKAFLAERLTNERGDLLGAIDVMVAARPSIDLADTIERAERAARLMAANGFGFVRTHVDTTLDNGLLSVEALVEVRHRVADLLDVEIVALSGWPVTGPEGDGAAGVAARRDRARVPISSAAARTSRTAPCGRRRRPCSRSRRSSASASTCTRTRPWTRRPTVSPSSPTS